MEELFHKHKFDTVVNFAAVSDVDRSISSPNEFIKTNIVGTHAMLSVSRKYWERLGSLDQKKFRLLHKSTDEVYGTLLPKKSPFSEQTPYSPRNPYSASKAASDHLVASYFYTYGLPTIISHCSNNYGPFQFPKKLVPMIILNAINGQSIPIYGDGKRIRDWPKS